MVDFDEDTDDLDALIDKAVDTFFVEEPDLDERAELVAIEEEPASDRVPEPEAPQQDEGPSFDEAVDTLFMGAFEEEAKQAPPSVSGGPSVISSGDVETDRAIDLAVDTLFVEEPETPAPETAQIDVQPLQASLDEDAADAIAAETPQANELPPPAAPEPAPPTTASSETTYDDAMAAEIQRHMHTLYKETAQKPDAEAARLQRPGPVPPVPDQRQVPSKAGPFPLRQLQEAILTLEWEISQRSVTALASEIRKIRSRFQDNVTVDFAALSMRVVLDYVVKRMSRAHPESIRFLLDITDYLGSSLDSSTSDPLVAFHDILTRYEKYKSSVRKAEGIPDSKPTILNQLSIADPDAFSRSVFAHALTLKRAGQALAEKLSSADDPENLIRSFRFLVSRSMNRILESTLDIRTKKPRKAKVRRRR